MEQNSDTSAPIAPVVENNKQNGGNGLKIAIAIACIVAVCGMGFGAYGVMQVSDKDNQISNLKTQIEKLEAVEKNEGPTITDIDIDESNDGESFSANILTNIKNLGDSTYGFKSINSGNGTVYAYINSNGDLILEKDKKYTVASNVIFADFLWEGNGGAPSLYFVKDNGSVGVVKNVTYDTESPTPEEVAIASKAVSVKNITTRAGHKVVVIDIDGNFVNL
ncbi:hypothetical protein J6X73_03080 [Candidatus Saccharibacteria bacterium]|nr:hypothetical protein [Candidatus Saccharibacteria bacterium]